MFPANPRGFMASMELPAERKMPAIDRSVVADIPLFTGIAPDQLDEILREARAVRYAKDTAVFEQGAEANAFYVLLHGHLRVEKTTAQGHQIVVRYVSPGEIFGVAQALAMQHYPATAVAAVDSVALCWPAAAWPRLTSRFPALAANALQTVGRRLQDTQSRVIEMSSEQVEQRVAHALLRLAKQAGRKTEAGIEIDFPISRQDVAEMTGTTLHTVSRILSAWESQGLVEGGRQRIVLRNPHGLFGLAEGQPRSATG
jgi:CRP/FNR family transcriptional regulator, nitrogen oxide reductase regulator